MVKIGEQFIILRYSFLKINIVHLSPIKISFITISRYFTNRLQRLSVNITRIHYGIMDEYLNVILI